MMMHQSPRRRRIVTIAWGAMAACAIGAGPVEPWQGARSSLPPVVVPPPGSPVVRPQSQAAVPQTMPARTERSNPFAPVAPPALTSRPAPVVPTRAPAIPAPAFAPPTQVYIIDGVDPFGLGGLSQLADRIRDSGYPDTHIGPWHQVLRFDREIRAAHRQDPGTQFIIIGYSYGVYRARALASRLARDGVPVVMVGYVGGDYLRNSPASQPQGVGQVVNVMGDGYLLTGRNLFFNGTELDGAANVRMPGVRHFDLPKQEQTYGALVSGMNAATSRTWTTTPGIVNAAGVPARIATGPETQRQQPVHSFYPPSTVIRR